MAVEISRRDILSDQIYDLSSETRFLKLPVPPYLELLGIEPLPSQVVIINAINNPKYRFVCAAVSRRQGKTYIANIIGQLVSLVPGSNILIMSPNYSLSQISFDLQRNLIKHFDLEVTKDKKKEAKKSMSDAEFRQEYEADFNTYEGQIWKFNFEENVKDLSNFDTSKMDVFAGLDVGYKDPTALCVIAYDWDSETFYLVDEYLNAERTTEQHAMEIQKLIDRWDIDYIYIDSAAQQTRFDFAQNYGISTINAKKSVLDGIGHVANIIDNDKLLVDQEAKQSLTCLDAYQWDPNPNLVREKPKHNMASHMADAIRYALYSFIVTNVTF